MAAINIIRKILAIESHLWYNKNTKNGSPKFDRKESPDGWC